MLCCSVLKNSDDVQPKLLTVEKMAVEQIYIHLHRLRLFKPSACCHMHFILFPAIARAVCYLPVCLFDILLRPSTGLCGFFSTVIVPIWLTKNHRKRHLHVSNSSNSSTSKASGSAQIAVLCLYETQTACSRSLS